MSLRAELLRLALRYLMKPTNHPGVTVARRRQRVAAFERWVPSPPADVTLRRTALGGVPALRVATPATEPHRRILFLHGGAYICGSPELYRQLLWRIAGAARAEVAAIDYRLAPEHPFPAALDDAVAAWRALLIEGGEPQQIAVVGDSAGGGLTLALALRLRDAGEPLPGAVVALSPWTDLACTGESLYRKAAADPILNPDDVAHLAGFYLSGADPHSPYASPLYGDPRGLPPTLIQVGSDEILRDDAVRMADRMRLAGVPVELESWPRMPHVWHAFAALLPEARQAIARIGEFLHRRLGAATPVAARD